MLQARHHTRQEVILTSPSSRPRHFRQLTEHIFPSLSAPRLPAVLYSPSLAHGIADPEPSIEFKQLTAVCRASFSDRRPRVPNRNSGHSHSTTRFPDRIRRRRRGLVRWRPAPETTHARGNKKAVRLVPQNPGPAKAVSREVLLFHVELGDVKEIRLRVSRAEKPHAEGQRLHRRAVRTFISTATSQTLR